MRRLISLGYGNSFLSSRECITEGLEMDVNQWRLQGGTWPMLLSPAPI